ncbi:hypothetical protein [Nocardia sp. NBC_00416]|uniref:hypothetical protein n=1 Tax=Nocardia sp. NBC_00416 TaxID=2975991 RepID=UPI002E212CC8
MATGVGLHIAEHACTAAVVDDDGDPHFILREPVLHMSDDGDAALGGAVPPPGHTHTITGFVAAVGDPAGVAVDDGEAYRGEDLLATAMFCLINLTAEYLNGPAEFLATHPAEWPAAQVLALRGALDYLGLKSVALIGEDELPARPRGLTPVETGRYFAENAGRAALAAVLETPAGATPPDPSTAQNSALDTLVMPKLRDGDTPAKAYSAVVPAMDPETTYGGPSLAVLAAGLGPTPGPRIATGSVAAMAAVDPSKPEKPEKPEAKAAPPESASDSGGARRTAALVAAAALGGVVIGALGVTAILRPGAAEPNTQPATSVTETPAPPAPEPPPILPQPIAPEPEAAYTSTPTYEPEPSYPVEPPVTTPAPTTVTETAPAPTTDPSSPTTWPSGPTLTEPTETETTTTRTRPRFFPFPVPFRTEDPDVELPDTGSKEGGQEEAR